MNTLSTRSKSATRAIRERNSILARFTARKVTLLARLRSAQERQNEMQCDRILGELNIIDEIITGLSTEIAHIHRQEGKLA